MRITVASSGYPGPSGGSNIILLVSMQALASLGHEVRHVKLDIRGQAPSSPGTMPFPSRRLAVDSFQHVDPEASAELVQELNAWNTDAVAFYGYEPLGALQLDLLP